LETFALDIIGAEYRAHIEPGEMCDHRAAGGAGVMPF